MTYAADGIAEQQRALVDQQLAAMRAGNPPAHFVSLGRLLQWLRDEVDDPLQLKLLDAACASGYYYEIIQHYVGEWIDYVGVDFNRGMVAMAQRLYPGLPILQGDVCNLHMLSDDSFDIVLSGATIMHIEDWPVAVTELARVADRWLILHRTWIFDQPTQVDRRDAYGQIVPYITFNRTELHDLLGALGFIALRTVDSGEQSPFWDNETILFERA